jgi:uncharacterized protein (TIGR00369 family)
MPNVLRSWQRATRLPGGARLFSVLAGRAVPYTGTLGAVVEVLRPGFARVRLGDRHRVRNHLGSVHAMALANLAEMTGNLALMAALPDSGNMIVTGFAIEYVKKARGELVATCALPSVDFERDSEVTYHVELRDRTGDLVASADGHCRVRRAKVAA